MEETVEEVDVAARIAEIFEGFVAKGAPGAEAGATYLLQLEGEHGGTHLLKVSPGAIEHEAGYTGDADVVVKLSVEDFLSMADGNFDGRLAAASERIEISGDMAAAEALVGSIEPEERL